MVDHAHFMVLAPILFFDLLRSRKRESTKELQIFGIELSCGIPGRMVETSLSFIDFTSYRFYHSLTTLHFILEQLLYVLEASTTG